MPDLWYWGPVQGMVLNWRWALSPESTGQSVHTPNLPRGAHMFSQLLSCSQEFASKHPCFLGFQITKAAVLRGSPCMGYWPGPSVVGWTSLVGHQFWLVECRFWLLEHLFWLVPMAFWLLNVWNSVSSGWGWEQRRNKAGPLQSISG